MNVGENVFYKHNIGYGNSHVDSQSKCETNFHTVHVDLLEYSERDSSKRQTLYFVEATIALLILLYAYTHL